jgi:DNA-binding NarL/FixJ family response regulator
MPRHRPARGDVRIVIADDHEPFRVRLGEILRSQDLEVVGLADTGETALDVVTRMAPDVALVCLELPGMSAIELTGRIRALSPRTRVIALTVKLASTELIDALAAGACGYLTKDRSLEAIAPGIVRSAAADEPLVSARTTRALISRLRAVDGNHAAPDAIRARLSQRELQVLELIAQGMDNADIGRSLFISPETVKHHVRTMLVKLEVQNRVQAAVLAVRAGVV